MVAFEHHSENPFPHGFRVGVPMAAHAQEAEVLFDKQEIDVCAASENVVCARAERSSVDLRRAAEQALAPVPFPDDQVQCPQLLLLFGVSHMNTSVTHRGMSVSVW